MLVYLMMIESPEDSSKFEKIYYEYRALMFHIANKILNNEQDAEDAVQTCFLKIAERYERYRYQPNENMIRLGCTVVRHAAIDMVREKEMKMTFTDEIFSWEDSVPDVAPDILDQLIQKTDQGLMTKAIMQLSVDERNYLYLHYTLNLKAREIGDLLDMKPSAVRKKLYQCRSKLAVILEGEEFECLR